MVNLGESKAGDPIKESVEQLQTFWIDALQSSILLIDKTLAQRPGLQGAIGKLMADIKKYSGVTDGHRMELSEVIAIRRNVEGSDIQLVLAVPWQEKHSIFLTVGVNQTKREVIGRDYHDSQRFSRESTDWYRTHADRSADSVTHAVSIGIDSIVGNPVLGKQTKYLAGYQIERRENTLALGGVLYAQGRRPFQIDQERLIKFGTPEETKALIGKFDNAIGAAQRHLRQFGDFI